MSKLKKAFVVFVLSIILIPSTLFPQVISNSVKTMQVDALWPGGELGLNLTGAGYDKIGMWFTSSKAPFDHTEFGNRLLNSDGYSGSVTNHETSTAGIIIAEGKNELAKGMAYQASLKAFDSWDTVLEKVTEAENGMEITSNSYAGAYTSNYSDGTFIGYHAYYGRTDSINDDIAYKYNHFLVFQAGGHRQEVDGVSGQGKNLVSVGSVQVLAGPYTVPGDVISAGSKLGPAFDGRIKPDLVAPGGPSLMCNVNDEYAMTGPATSYSAPAAAGASVLLQQHYQNTHNNIPMLSSELKGILIHTAEEAGSAPGPDAEFGWGLINAKRAANLITMDVEDDDIISTQTKSRDLFEKLIYVSKYEPLKVTICWIDPPGIAGHPHFFNDYYVDPSPRLINDLDLKIVDEFGNSYYPWTLDTMNPLVANKNSQNHLDNVEQVLIETPVSGWYTIQVDNTGHLEPFGAQDFSMIISRDINESIPKIDKQSVLDELQEAYPVGDKKVDKELYKAIVSIGESLNNEYWENDFYLTDKGNKVFDEEKKAVKSLAKIIDDKKSNIFKAEAENAINELVEIDRVLAQLLIDKAIENNGDGKEIEKALEEMDDAQEEVDEKDFDKAIDNYKKAWLHAYLALKKVGLAKINDSAEVAVSAIASEETGFRLGNNYPNPFNPTTEISYQVPEPSEVHITIYNLLGERVAQLVNEYKDIGNYTVRWNGTDSIGNQVSNGVYLYELRSSNFKQVKRMSFIK